MQVKITVQSCRNENVPFNFSIDFDEPTKMSTVQFSRATVPIVLSTLITSSRLLTHIVKRRSAEFKTRVSFVYYLLSLKPSTWPQKISRRKNYRPTKKNQQRRFQRWFPNQLMWIILVTMIQMDH